MDEVELARLRVVAACGASAAHCEAVSQPTDQDVVNEQLAHALAEYRRSLIDE
ncbi:hypothetical protein [Saccharopolyspora sp. NPDC002376]